MRLPLGRILSDSLLERTLARRMTVAEGVGLFRVRERVPGGARRAVFAIDSLGWLVGAGRAPKEVAFDFSTACDGGAAEGDTLVLPVPPGSIERLEFTSCPDAARLSSGLVRFLGFDPLRARERFVRRGAGYIVDPGGRP